MRRDIEKHPRSCELQELTPLTYSVTINKDFLILVSHSQTFRLTAEGLGTLAALNGEGLPRGHMTDR